MRIEIGPTGRIVQGTILDMNKATLERALRSYDRNLYITWNPNKSRGMGKWELRCRPEKREIAANPDMQKDLDDAMSFVKDFHVLNYKILDHVKQSDLWSIIGYQGDDTASLRRVERFASDFLDGNKRYQIENREKLANEARYNLRQEKGLIKWYREAILSGRNPADIARYWK